MRQNKKRTDRVAIALVLCFCVVAIASVFTVKSGIDKLNNIAKPNIDISSEKQEKEKDVIKPVPTVDSQSKEEQPAQDNAQQGASGYVTPVKGNVLMDYSKDVPIYSKTLDQYMTHEGVDIAANPDTQVKAIAAGTVTNVYTDDRYGITVEVNHGNGITSIYANLSTTKLIETGDVVKKGQVISGVGETALFETLEVPHLHFEMKKDGETVNPSDYVQF